MLKAVILCSVVALAVSVPIDCKSPAIKEKGAKCVKQMGPMLEKLKTVNSGSWLDAANSKQLHDMCVVSLDCFRTLQKCAGIEEALVLNMEGVCSMFDLVTGDFQHCVNKLEEHKSQKCVSNFFLDPAFASAKDAKTRCNNFRTDGQCVKKKADEFCAKGASKLFQQHLDEQLKRYSC